MANKLNWKNGLLRIWIVVCVVWPIVWFGPRLVKSADGAADVTASDLAWGLAPILLSIAVLILYKTICWIVRGFTEVERA